MGWRASQFGVSCIPTRVSSPHRVIFGLSADSVHNLMWIIKFKESPQVSSHIMCSPSYPFHRHEHYLTCCKRLMLSRPVHGCLLQEQVATLPRTWLISYYSLATLYV